MTREEAINKLRQMTLPEETREILVALAPELAESEDDRNWKSIEKAIRGFITSPIDADELLAWLEKQKEQKPNIELIQRSWYMEGYHDREFGKEPKWVIKTGEGGPKHELNPRYGEPLTEQRPTEEQLHNLNEAIKSFRVDGFDRIADSLHSLYNILKTQEQYPSSKFRPNDWVVYDGPLGHAILQIKDVVGGRYSFVDNDSTLLVEDSDKFLHPLTPKDVEKPAEWSEVELEFRGEKVKVKRPFFRDDNGRGYSTTEQDEEVAWNALRAWCEKKSISLYDLYPKVEWSEDDEETIGALINYFEGDALDYSADEMIRRIRALRPSLKPSKEQMKALQNAVALTACDKELVRLYNQLKKLM